MNRGETLWIKDSDGEWLETTYEFRVVNGEPLGQHSVMLANGGGRRVVCGCKTRLADPNDLRLPSEMDCPDCTQSYCAAHNGEASLANTRTPTGKPPVADVAVVVTRGDAALTGEHWVAAADALGLDDIALVASSYERLPMGTRLHSIAQALATIEASAYTRGVIEGRRLALAAMGGRAANAWRPLHDREGFLNVDEGAAYWFAVETSGGWEYFQDSIVWDSECEPQWSDGGHGWDIDDVTHFRAPFDPPTPEST